MGPQMRVCKMRTWSFAKGHGTMNDFVIIKDRSGLLDPSAEDVRFLCDRRRGVGGDGVLRAVKASHMPEWDGPGDIWFMDYRNADGSLAQTCGNGLRVFVQWLLEEDLATGDVIDIATRAGIRRARVHTDGVIAVTMGTPRWEPAQSQVRLGDRQWYGHPVDVGNEHCVIRLEDVDELAGLDLTVAPVLDPVQFPHGANVEFVVRLGDNKLRLRVFERGVGETMSCGTGVVAASCDELHQVPSDERSYRVEVPGGRLKVEFAPGGEASLVGPACIVARGEVTLPNG